MAMTYTYSLNNRTASFGANSVRSGAQTEPDVLGLSGGGFVAAYNSQGTIYLNCHDAATQAAGGARAAFDADGTSALYQPVMTELANGNVLVVWNDALTDRLQARVFSPDGTRGALYDLQTSEGSWEVAATADGGFIVSSWDYQGGRPNYFDVQWFRYDATGHLQQKLLKVEAGAGGEAQVNGAVAVLTNGDFVVTYTDNADGAFPVPGNDANIRAVVYDGSGGVRKADFLVDGQGTDAYMDAAHVAALPGDRWAVAYETEGMSGEGGTTGIRLKIFDADGNQVGATRQVNDASTAANEKDPDITVLENGFIVVSWTRQSDNADIFGRVFDQFGNPVTLNGNAGDFLIRESGEVWEDKVSAISAIVSGRFVTAFQDNVFTSDYGTNGGDGSGSGIVARVQEVTRLGIGDDSADVAVGDALSDAFYGWGGADRLYGEGGNDFLFGFDGNDHIEGGTGDDLLSGFADNDELFGDDGNDTLAGGDGNDSLAGGGGKDDLDGGTGLDRLAGGAGDDVYHLADVTLYEPVISEGGAAARALIIDPFRIYVYDTVDEGADGGIDTVHVRRVAASASQTVSGYALPANVENGVIDNSDGFSLTGNAIGNALIGNAGADTLNGLGGVDTLIGGLGNDTLDGGAVDDPATQGNFMLGGDGNDTYHVRNTFDLVDEGYVFASAGFGGDDTVISHANWYWDVYGIGETISIAADASDPTGAGTTIVGGVFNNTLIGNAGNNVMFGRGGSDVYRAGDGNDYISLGLLGVPDTLYDGVDGHNTVIVDPRTTGATSYDILYEFDPARDKVDVSAYHYATFAKLMTHAVNDGSGNCYIALGDGLDYLYMVGLTKAQLNVGDFIL